MDEREERTTGAPENEDAALPTRGAGVLLAIAVAIALAIIYGASS
jgi:hypothetical protein